MSLKIGTHNTTTLEELPPGNMYSPFVELITVPQVESAVLRTVPTTSSVKSTVHSVPFRTTTAVSRSSISNGINRTAKLHRIVRISSVSVYALHSIVYLSIYYKER